MRLWIRWRLHSDYFRMERQLGRVPEVILETDRDSRQIDGAILRFLRDPNHRCEADWRQNKLLSQRVLDHRFLRPGVDHQLRLHRRVLRAWGQCFDHLWVTAESHHHHGAY